MAQLQEEPLFALQCERAVDEARSKARKEGLDELEVPTAHSYQVAKVPIPQMDGWIAFSLRALDKKAELSVEDEDKWNSLKEAASHGAGGPPQKACAGKFEASFVYTSQNPREGSSLASSRVYTSAQLFGSDDVAIQDYEDHKSGMHVALEAVTLDPMAEEEAEQNPFESSLNRV